MQGLLRSTEPGSRAEQRWAIRFRVEGDVRFISHRDTLRLFQRAVARAGLPVRYTTGFNPRMRLSIPLPRSVGVASDAELLVVEFVEPVDGARVLSALRLEMPGGITLDEAAPVDARTRFQPTQVRYRLDMGAPPDRNLESRVDSLLRSTALPIERRHHGSQRTRTLDVRRYVTDVRIDNGALEFTLRVEHGATVRPAEVAELLGFDTAAVTHRIRRVHVEWENGKQ